MQIFPKEIIENTVQVFLPKSNVKSKAIYGIILSAVLLVVLTLPFIKIKIFTTANGIIRPSKERIAITSLNSGKVQFSRMISNKYVEKGDVLLILESDILNGQIALSEYESERYIEEITDLKYLLHVKNIQRENIKSSKYQKAYFQYLETTNEHRIQIKKLKKDLERNQKLFARGVIAKADFENIQLDYDLAVNNFGQFQKSQQNTWQTLLSELENSLEASQNKTAQYNKSKKEHIITAPINGSLVNLSGIEKGSLITSGIVLGEISPDTDLLAECYVSPLDIGLINKSKSVSFQIDAFNYRQWGLASGNIIDVSEDVELLDNQPIFKLRCRLNEEFLQLKNGAKGIIGKGMTFKARFELTERTLYQLLYDKVDDWMNPIQNSQNSTD